MPGPAHVRLTAEQAHALVALAEQDNRRYPGYYKIRPRVHGEQLITRSGAKISWIGHGAAGSYWLTGYHFDGSDVRTDLNRIGVSIETARRQKLQAVTN